MSTGEYPSNATPRPTYGTTDHGNFIGRTLLRVWCHCMLRTVRSARCSFRPAPCRVQDASLCAVRRCTLQVAPCGTRWLLSGEWLMRVRPRQTGWLAADGTSLLWPEGTAPGDTLAVVVSRHPHEAAALLDFEVSFGSLRDGCWRIEHSTRPALEGRSEAFAAHRTDTHTAEITGSGNTGARWQLLEWDAPDSLR